MAQQLLNRNTSAQNNQQTTGPEPTGKGRVWPNLFFGTDIGKNYVEFRAQCEVWLSREEADEARELISGPRLERNKAKFDKALRIILKRADAAGAKPAFKDILRRSFKAQPEYGAVTPRTRKRVTPRRG